MYNNIVVNIYDTFPRYKNVIKSTRGLDNVAFYCASTANKETAEKYGDLNGRKKLIKAKYKMHGRMNR